jgi:hypothetical protein
MAQLMYYDTGSGQWLPVVVGAQGTQGISGSYAAQGIQGTQGTLGTTVYDSDQGVLSQQMFS